VLRKKWETQYISHEENTFLTLDGTHFKIICGNKSCKYTLDTYN